MVTRLGLGGFTRPPYGSFEGKIEYIPPVTRLALYGGARPPYGSFAGKIGGGGPQVNTRMSPAPQQQYKTSKPQGVYLSS